MRTAASGNRPDRGDGKIPKKIGAIKGRRERHYSPPLIRRRFKA
jgi:hypothetical protein